MYHGPQKEDYKERKTKDGPPPNLLRGGGGNTLKMLCSVKQRQACGVGKLPLKQHSEWSQVQGQPGLYIQPGLQGENLSQKTKTEAEL